MSSAFPNVHGLGCFHTSRICRGFSMSLVTASVPCTNFSFESENLTRVNRLSWNFIDETIHHNHIKGTRERKVSKCSWSGLREDGKLGGWSFPPLLVTCRNHRREVKFHPKLMGWRISGTQLMEKVVSYREWNWSPSLRPLIDIWRLCRASVEDISRLMGNFGLTCRTLFHHFTQRLCPGADLHSKPLVSV